MFAATVQYSTAIHTTRYHSSAATVAKAAAAAAAGVTGEKTDGRGKVSYPIFCSGAGDDEGTGGRGERLPGFARTHNRDLLERQRRIFLVRKEKKGKSLPITHSSCS